MKGIERFEKSLTAWIQKQYSGLGPFVLHTARPHQITWRDKRNKTEVYAYLSLNKNSVVVGVQDIKSDQNLKIDEVPLRALSESHIHSFREFLSECGNTSE